MPSIGRDDSTLYVRYNFCSDTSSPTQQHLQYCPQVVLTYQQEWDPLSVSYSTDTHSEEEEHLFAGIAEIRVNAWRSKVHGTNIETGLCNTIHNMSSIATRLVSQVIIAYAKVPDATRITDIDKDVFLGRHQDVLSHQTFTSKERYSGVNPSELIKR